MIIKIDISLHIINQIACTINFTKNYKYFKSKSWSESDKKEIPIFISFFKLNDANEHV